MESVLDANIYLAHQNYDNFNSGSMLAVVRFFFSVWDAWTESIEILFPV